MPQPSPMRSSRKRPAVQPDVPTWKTKLRAGRLATLAGLTPVEEAQRAADDAAERHARAGRRAKKAAEALLINQRAVLGDTPQEISERLGIGVAGLRGRARRWGHALMQRAGYRRLSSWVADRHVRMLDALATDAGLSREKALEAILAATFADPLRARQMVLPVKREAAA